MTTQGDPPSPLLLPPLMAYSGGLHAPLLRLPVGPRTPEHIPVSLLPLTSTRAGHITRLYNLLIHLISLPPSPRTTTQTVRAWRALAGCREVHLATLWRVGAAVIERSREGGGFDDEDEEEERRERAARRAEWLKFCQEGREDKVDKFHEYVLALVAAGRAESALDELDAYLDNQPYHDSIALNTLYGQLALLIAQPATSAAPPPPSSSSSSDSDEELSTQWRRRRNERAAKRAKTDADAASADEDYAALLRSVALNSPALLNKATERFKRAAQLEERFMREENQAASVKGEAARWLSMIRRFVDKTSSREASPA